MPFTLDYRPTDFASTVGQDHILTVLEQQIKTDSAKSNYLFFGPRGTGKTTTARIMAKALNCNNLNDGNPCGTCDSCTHIGSGKTLDFVEIDAASHTGVDNIREEIIDKALYPPTALAKKIYIIDEVHMLSKGAFNALLKIMEEPPAYMTFILATTEIHKIPDTIISRCQTFQFRHLTVPQLEARLQYIAQEENIKTEPEAITLIAKTAEGIMRDAIKYLEQVSVLGTISLENVRQYLGVVGDKQLVEILETIRHEDFSTSLTQLESLYQSGVDLSVFAKQMLGYIDEHFAQDPVWMSSMAELFGSIASKLKHMPQPLLAYKIGIHHHLFGSTNQTSQEKKTVTQKKTPTKTVETKVDKEFIIEDKKEPAPSAPKEPTKKATPPTSGGSISPEQLKEALVRHVETSAKSLVEKYVVIQELSEHNVTLLAINKMAEISLSKDKESLEKIIEDVLGSPRKVTLSFMSKEAYFASLS